MKLRNLILVMAMCGGMTFAGRGELEQVGDQMEDLTKGTITAILASASFGVFLKGAIAVNGAVIAGTLASVPTIIGLSVFCMAEAILLWDAPDVRQAICTKILTQLNSVRNGMKQFSESDINETMDTLKSQFDLYRAQQTEKALNNQTHLQPEHVTHVTQNNSHIVYVLHDVLDKDKKRIVQNRRPKQVFLPVTCEVDPNNNLLYYNVQTANVSQKFYLTHTHNEQVSYVTPQTASEIHFFTATPHLPNTPHH